MKRLIGLIFGSALVIGAFAACDQTEPVTSSNSSAKAAIEETSASKGYAVELPPSPADMFKNKNARKLVEGKNIFPPGAGN